MGTQIQTTPGRWSVTVEGTNYAELCANIQKIAQATETIPVTAKKAKAPVVEEEEVEDDTLAEVEVEDDEDTVEKVLTLKGDIIPAFRAYVKEHGTKSASQILGRFKAKSVTDLKPKDYPKVMNAIG